MSNVDCEMLSGGSVWGEQVCYLPDTGGHVEWLLRLAVILVVVGAVTLAAAWRWQQ